MIACRIRFVLLTLTAILPMTGSALAAGDDLSRIGLAGEVPRTARRLAAADDLAAHEKWPEAVDEYYRILTEAGDDLVALDASHSLSARRACHLRLAACPPAALRHYRDRVQSQAKKWLEQGSADRDPVPLRRLVEESFCSRSTDAALDLLGDLAFERGEFEEAERWWRLLALPASQQGTSKRPAATGFLPATLLLFPDPQLDVARVRAKQLLARLFRGQGNGWQQELTAFRALHATAKGLLAGRDDMYVDILQTLAGQQEILASPALEHGWPTFGGPPSRNQVVARAPGRTKLQPANGLHWTVRLDAAGGTASAASDLEPMGKGKSLSLAARSLGFHPVIDGERVFVADARRVLGYSLFDGRQILRYDLADHVKQDLLPKLARLNLDLPLDPDLSYTLSVADNRVYARLGAQALGPARKDSASDPNHTFLVCLDLQFNVSGRVQRWLERSQGTAAAGPVFEGAPLVDHGRVFIAESRFAGGQTQTAIGCYDGDTGKLRWQTDVCSALQVFRIDEGKQRVRHHLLSLAGPTLFYCAHAGAIVALEAATGRRLWGVRYPHSSQQKSFAEVPPRDLAPCLCADSRLYVAPLDCDRIFCLDPETGRTIWEDGPLQVNQLLGVAKGRLIFTANTPRPCIRAVDAATGSDLRYWMHPADGSELKTFGRGALVGDWVLWPIRSDRREGIFVLDQETGEPIRFEERISGNLAVANGCLVVAGERELSVYPADGRFPPAAP